MSARLLGFSMHSVKGGVGKSTFATLVALRAARRLQVPTYLIDMDLTGTSLADVLPLVAPRWREHATDSDEQFLDLTCAPGGFFDRHETRLRIEQRGARGTVQPAEVPFLNDFLLFATPDWDEQTDVELAPTQGGMPVRLRDTPILWRASLLTTLDRQDLRAAARWLTRLEPSDIAQGQVGVVLNRAPLGDPRQRQAQLETILGDLGELHPLLHAPTWVDERDDLQIFRQEHAPADFTALDTLLDALVAP